MGIPEERARVYNDRVSRGEYLIVVDGTDADISRAEAILGRRGIQEWGIYNTPAVDAARTDHSVANRYDTPGFPAEPAVYGTTGTHPVDTTRTDVSGDPKVIIVDNREQI